MCFLANKIRSTQDGNHTNAEWTTISHPNRNPRRESSQVLCSVPVSDHLNDDDGGGGDGDDDGGGFGGGGDDVN